MSRRNSLLCGTMLSGVGGVFLTALSGQAVVAQSLSDVFDKAAYANAVPKFSGPAVDGVNGKIAGFGGSLGRKSAGGVEGSLQIPLGFSHGLQFDPRVGSVGGNTFGEIGMHLFWRNPAVGLAGLYVNHVHLDRFGGVHATAVAAEGEWYWGRWTLQGIAGVAFGNSASSATVATMSTPAGGGGTLTTTTTFFQGYDIKTQFFDQINLKYYLTDNWAGYVGHRYLGEKHAFAIGTEVVVPLEKTLATTAFLEARAGNGDFTGVWGGMKFYFGHKGKSLIQRNRENDDPPIWSNLFILLNSATKSGASSTTLQCPSGEVPDSSGTTCIGGET